MELQWVMVMELERAILPIDEQLQKEKSRIPRNQQNITKAEVRFQSSFIVFNRTLGAGFSRTPTEFPHLFDNRNVSDSYVPLLTYMYMCIFSVITCIDTTRGGMCLRISVYYYTV